jgi:uncharacterized protein YegP (UPF0339 family)
MKNPKFVLSKNSKGEHYFVLKARNGKVLLTSEGYAKKDGALNGIETIRKIAPHCGVEEIKEK